MKNYDLIVVSYESFPKGMATSNRILSYTVPLAEKGFRILLLTFSGPSYGFKLNSDAKGSIVENLDYIWTDRTYYEKRPCLAIRCYRTAKRRLKLIFLLLFKYRAKVYLQVNRSSSLSIFLRILSKINSAGFFREISETFENDSCILRRWFRSFACRFTDGIIVISQGIRDYLKGIKDESHFFLLPILVDLKRFDIVSRNIDTPYFFYCSGGVLERDGFLDSLKAFLLFNTAHKDYKLLCAFPFDKDDPIHREVMSIIESNSDRVEYLGSLPTNRIPYYLVNARALLVTPAHNYRTSGFPTKLGEYLASSRPVICTSIDNLKSVLEPDCVLMAEPGNINSIASMMDFVAFNPGKADETGIRGRNHVEKNFTATQYLTPLIDFLFG